MEQKWKDPAGQGGVRRASDWRHSPDNNLPYNKMRCALGSDGAFAGSLDPQAIRVELSERRRRSGDTFPVAACSIAKVEGTAAPICNLARKLLALGVDPARHLSIWRGKTKCFDDAPISVWARLTVSEGPSGTVFRRYEPFLGLRVASGRAESDV